MKNVNNLPIKTTEGAGEALLTVTDAACKRSKAVFFLYSRCPKKIINNK